MAAVNASVANLLIDADDTLWENNIYFEQVIGEFVQALQQQGIAAPTVHEVLWRTERKNIRITGYGSQAFCASLQEAAQVLGGAPLADQVARWEQLICGHPIQLLRGVAETLPLLKERGHRLILFTKGNPAEQLAKLQRSGLAGYFEAAEVVFEKTAAVYQQWLGRHDLAVERTWMIGNSPRSDINPAKAIGLGTVFIPYHTTWQHEIEEIAPGGRPTLVLEHFGLLGQHLP